MKKNIFKTLAVTVLSAVSLTAWAVEPYAGLVNTTTEITFDGKAWYLIEDNSTAANAGTVTLLAKDPIGKSKFHGSSNKYSSSEVRTYLDNLTGTNGSFASVADAIETVKVKGSDSDSEVDAKLWLLSTTEVNTTYNLPDGVKKCSTSNGEEDYWWLRSPGNEGIRAACVDRVGGYVDVSGLHVFREFGVRPALKLNLSKVTFDTETKTFSVAPTTSVATPTLSPADAAKSNIWYDLNGRHYQGKPTMPGVYINNHQKYFVK